MLLNHPNFLTYTIKDMEIYQNPFLIYKLTLGVVIL